MEACAGTASRRDLAVARTGAAIGLDARRDWFSDTAGAFRAYCRGACSRRWTQPAGARRSTTTAPASRAAELDAALPCCPLPRRLPGALAARQSRRISSRRGRSRRYRRHARVRAFGRMRSNRALHRWYAADGPASTPWSRRSTFAKQSILRTAPLRKGRPRCAPGRHQCGGIEARGADSRRRKGSAARRACLRLACAHRDL